MLKRATCRADERHEEVWQEREESEPKRAVWRPLQLGGWSLGVAMACDAYKQKKKCWQALRSPAVGSVGCSKSESCRMEVAYFLGQRLIEL